MSTNTGTAPRSTNAFAVDTNVNDGISTSSPGSRSSSSADISSAAQPTRVIVYNGSGIPGIAGVAARELIRLGYKVVDTRNADRFDYATTQIVLQHGEDPLGKQLQKELGVGTVVVQDANQQIADVIIIVGKDYAPKAGQDG